MASGYLYERITNGRPGSVGTLAEPDGTPEPRFALQSTVNWMHALALIIQAAGLDWTSMIACYRGVDRFTALTDRAANTIYEQLLMSLHHLSALRAMEISGHHQDFARIGVMTWYYGIYCAASAMIAAKDGSQQQDHSSTAAQWDRQIAAAELAPAPFGYRISTLVKVAATAELDALRSGNAFVVNSRPTNVDDARGACISYLSGTRDYREWQITEELKTKELPRLGVTDFRTTAARQLRDARLAGKTLGFLHQAFRYRGKANYRDALYLTYEAQVGTVLDGFIDDMSSVLSAFVAMAGAFCSRRLTPNQWQNFVQDLDAHLQLSVMPSDVWI